MNKRFGFLLFNDFEDLDFAGPWELIAVWSKQFQGPQELVLISEKDSEVTSAKGLTVKTKYNFTNCPALDYLLVPGGKGTRSEVYNEKIIHFIQQQAVHCEQLLSVCTGAFLLQKAGLLKDKCATTHWNFLNELRNFSEVKVQEQRFVRDGHVWTSAGISAGMDMSLAFIAAMAGEKIAGDVQLFAEYYPQTQIYPASIGPLPAYI